MEMMEMCIRDRCNLKGGTPEQCAAAAAMALGNLLGLVCDPVAGLVEVPCIKRNVVGAVNAVSCANMALAGAVSYTHLSVRGRPRPSGSP